MTIKQQGGVFGRNPSFNDVDVNTLDVAGQVTAGSLNVDAGTLFVDAVNNFVGIGTAAPGDRLTVNGNIYLGATSRTVYTGGSADLRLQTNTGNTLISRDNGSTEIARFTTTGMAFPSGKGIDFSATSGTGTSELFDDYEEGTWTPVAADAETGGNTGTAGVANGYYTKVGNVVYVMGVLSNVNTTGLTSGNLFYIQGLPFSSKDLVGATAYYMSGGVLTSAVTITGNVQMYLNDLSKTAVGFYDAGGNILVSDLTSAAADFYFSLTYMAA